MKVIIACEESQTVCKAFRKLGHEAFSCDLQDCSGGKPEWHIQDDVLNHLNKNWDMIIAHPPCTYFSNAGLHYLKTKPKRKEQLQQMFDLTLKIWNAPIKFIAIENPIGWLNTNWIKPTQIIQPYYFGDPELKTTCLWLKNLPLLKYRHQDDLFGKKTATERPKPNGYCIRKSGKNAGKKYNYYWTQGKSAKQRSKTFNGIANAMAVQWSSHACQEHVAINEKQQNVTVVLKLSDYFKQLF